MKLLLLFLFHVCPLSARPRVIVTTDGEADDRCSMVRFLLSSNEFDVEGIVNSSSQFHWVGGEEWHAFHPVEWVRESIDRYGEVYPNLKKHDANYPSPQELLAVWKVGNIQGAGESEQLTEGAKWIAKVLLDQSDPRPIWVQAWGGCNTIARALRIIEQDHPHRMREVAQKLRLFLIWEQDETYQNSIRPKWEPLNLTTIISDQFDCMAYIWPKVLPPETQRFFKQEWMEKHLLNNHGALCSSYEHLNGAFHAEGDTPAFLHAIPNGLRSLESPGYGGWGGRYVRVRANVWMDPPPDPSWKHPDGRWTIDKSWAKKFENATKPEELRMRERYFRPITRWLEAIQNDFAARADWCVNDVASANHPPVVTLKETPLNLAVSAGEQVTLDASASKDPDGDELHYRWWCHQEVSHGSDDRWPVVLKPQAKFVIPTEVQAGEVIHFICEVQDSGQPPLTRYARVILKIKE